LGRRRAAKQAQIAEMGFKILTFPIGLLFAATKAMRTLLASIKEHGTPAEAAAHMVGFDEFLNFIGLPEIRSIEEQFRD
jgi:2,3-dimethylmalate lyase